MTKLIKKLASCVLTLTLLLGIAAMFMPKSLQTANALCDDYTEGNEYTIYYYYDAFPTVNYQLLASMFGSSYDIVYDEQGARSLSVLVEDDYFEGFGDNCIVIIDLQLPNADIGALYDLFTALKRQGCFVIFVYGDANAGLDISYFAEVVDYCINTDANDRYYNYVNGAMDRFINMYADVNGDGVITVSETEALFSDVTIFVDKHFVSIPDYQNIDIQYLYTESFAFRTLIDRLMYIFSESTVNGFVNLCRGTLDLKIIVHVSGEIYVDVLTGTVYDREELGAINFRTATMNEYTCALLWWNPDIDYYNFLFTVQYDIPIYLFEVDRAVYTLGGLLCYNEQDLGTVYYTQEMLDLIDYLQGLAGSV